MFYYSAGGDGTDMRKQVHQFFAEVDGTPGSNDMPRSVDISNNSLTVRKHSTERLIRIDSSGRLLQGKNATKGSTGENVPTYCTEIAKKQSKRFRNCK